MISFDKNCFPASGNIYLQLKLKMEALLAKRTFIKIIFSHIVTSSLKQCQFCLNHLKFCFWMLSFVYGSGFLFADLRLVEKITSLK